jgi:hypothetical protein
MEAETIHDFRSHVDPPAFTGLTAFRCLLPGRSAASPRARLLGVSTIDAVLRGIVPRSHWTNKMSSNRNARSGFWGP